MPPRITGVTEVTTSPEAKTSTIEERAERSELIFAQMASRAEIRASCFLMASQRDVSSYSEVQAIDENRVHVAIAIKDDNLMSLYIVSDSIVYVQVKGNRPTRISEKGSSACQGSMQQLVLRIGIDRLKPISESRLTNTGVSPCEVFLFIVFGFATNISQHFQENHSRSPSGRRYLRFFKLFPNLYSQAPSRGVRLIGKREA